MSRAGLLVVLNGLCYSHFYIQMGLNAFEVSYPFLEGGHSFSFN